jgi:hypothetical protein
MAGGAGSGGNLAKVHIAGQRAQQRSFASVSVADHGELEWIHARAALRRCEFIRTWICSEILQSIVRMNSHLQNTVAAQQWT